MYADVVSSLFNMMIADNEAIAEEMIEQIERASKHYNERMIRNRDTILKILADVNASRAQPTPIPNRFARPVTYNTEELLRSKDTAPPPNTVTKPFAKKTAAKKAAPVKKTAAKKKPTKKAAKTQDETEPLINDDTSTSESIESFVEGLQSKYHIEHHVQDLDEFFTEDNDSDEST